MNDTSSVDLPTRLFAGNRAVLGGLLIAFALLWAGAGGTAGYKAYKGWGATKPAADQKEGEPEPKLAIADPNASNYLLTAVLCGVGFVCCLGFALYGMNAQPLTPEANYSDVRRLLLAAGVVSGVLLMALGFWYFVITIDVLTKWLGRGEMESAWKPLTALLVFIAGAGLAFLATQPARAEERNNQGLRRLVYGSNIVVTVMLLGLLLVAGNVIAGVKIPNKLDTTESGFYTLQDSTAKFVKTLDTKVTMHVVLPESGGAAGDARRLIGVVQEANPEKVVVRYYSPSARNEIRGLKKKFPTADPEDYGVILAVGDDESRYSFIRADDMVKREGQGESMKVSFQGEARLMKELDFLTDTQSKPVAYFLQGHGEMTFQPMPDEVGNRTMRIAKEYIEKQGATCKPLYLDGPKADPKVPDDATHVVVADPKNGVPLATAELIRKYMDVPRPGGKKGKLLVLTGPHPVPGKAEVQPTGLEDLLAGYGIQIQPAYIYSQPNERMPAEMAIVGVAGAALDGRNPIAVTFSDTPMIFPACRPVRTQVSPPNAPPGPRAVALLGTASRPNWIEFTALADPSRTFEELLASEELQTKKQVARSRGVAAVAAEGAVGRVVVIGSGEAFSDEWVRVQDRANNGARLLAVSIDYLHERRERPDVATKEFGFYSLKPDYDGLSMLGLPLFLGVLALAALGAGVWIVRRQ